jgi:FSR family fosmidomycin resistance protein-like MFS transporter
VLLSFGHFFVDLYGSAIGALQPYLVEKLHLSLGQAGIAGGVLMFSSSVMQPVYGYLSDRFHTRLFTTLAPAVAGVCISCLGLASDFGSLVLLAAAAGAGIAAFHPQGSSLAAATSEHRGRAMAVFISAGTVGMAVGPTYFTTVISRFGLHNGAWAAVPGVLAAVALICLLPREDSNTRTTLRKTVDWSEIALVRKPLLVLYFLVFIRSVVQVTYAQFLPLYLHRERGVPISSANYMLSAYLLFGAIGGFIGGHLADRFGGRLVIMISMIGSLPLLGLFFLLGTGWLAAAGLALGGLVLLFTIPVNVVMAQDLAPRQAGTVSALMMGFSWGMAGLLSIPFTGWLADRIGMHTALSSLLVFPVLGFFLATLLPKEARR